MELPFSVLRPRPVDVAECRGAGPGLQILEGRNDEMFNAVNIAADKGAFRAAVAACAACAAFVALPLPLPTLPLTGAEGVCGRGIKDDTE